MKSIIALVAAATISTSAFAACTWRWDCTSGQCQQRPICEGPMDMPGIKPLGIAPIPSPSLRPIPTPMVPPIGTKSCAPRYFCSGMGQCNWQTVCQ